MDIKHNFVRSLSHLPENKRYEIHRIAEIIREVVNPEKVILFGSHAKGTQAEHRYQTRMGSPNPIKSKNPEAYLTTAATGNTNAKLIEYPKR